MLTYISYLYPRMFISFDMDGLFTVNQLGQSEMKRSSSTSNNGKVSKVTGANLDV
jgi:hypothetical protein